MNNCLECGHFTKNPKFCSSSCAAKYNNREYPKRKVQKSYCKNCGAELNGKKVRNKFCSTECHIQYKNKVYIKKWIGGEVSGGHPSKMSAYVRNYLIDKASGKCERCGWNEVNPYIGRSLLEIHHLDGDRSNNTLENLVVLCPNCHSLTENYRAMNIKNKK